ncbi:MAG: hypothetical protein HFP81_02415 [Methylococcales symbiont of Hymedesmia sp. n. MRB-2018]|nr:MAG: hypothetical protein HFP81_02415 [Methylococcales symbiont of Hymedesmia sp. n. MRB-2018]
MEKQHWEQICAQTATQMIDFIKPFTTPISRALSDIEGEHHGSGSYIEVNNVKYIITNEHVAKELRNNSLTHQFYKNENIYKLTNPAIAVPHPIDVAISKIESSSWLACEHEALAIPFNLFEQRHNPVKHELLFFAGYSGQRSRFLFGNMITPGTPYLTQESPFPENVEEADQKYHFSPHYSPDLATSIGGSSHLPDPHGFSGSLVWNTKRVECLMAEKEWKPELARVTGIVWAWPSSAACILATKVEYFGLNEITNIEVKNA